MSEKSHKLAEMRHALQARLDDFGQQVRRRLMLEASARFVALLAGLLLLSFILDRMLRLSHLTRRGLLLALLVTVGIQIWKRLLVPIRLSLSSDVLAGALEAKSHIPVAARVATVLELPVQEQDGPISEVMVEQAVVASNESLSQIDFSSQLDDHRKNVSMGCIAATCVLSLTLILMSPTNAWLWAARLFAGSDVNWPQRTYLEIAGLKDGVITVPRSEPFALRVSAKDGTTPPDSISLRWRQGNASRVTALLTKFGPNDFRYDFPAVQDDVVMSLSGGDDVIDPVRIHPIERPRFTELKLVAKHPTESQSHTYNFAGSDSDDLAFLPMTALELQFTANTAVGKVSVKSSTTKPSNADLKEIDDRHFSMSWQHAAATQLEIEMASSDAGLVSVPTAVSIGLKQDKAPRIVLSYSGVRQRVTPQATIPLLAEARDDLGVDRIELQLKADIPDAADPKVIHSTTSTKAVFGPTSQPGELQPEIRQPSELSVADLKLEPGHLLTVGAVAMDKCYTGAQSTSARAVSFRVVRPEDLFKEIRLRQSTERAKFRKQLDEARMQQGSLAYKPNDEALAEISKKHRAIQREVLRIQTALSDTLTEMRLNALGTDQAYEMMEKTILQPMKSLDVDFMTPQRDALDTLKASDAPGLTAAIDRQEQIVLEMQDILRAMTQWDSFIDVLNQLNEIIRLQNQAKQNTTQLKQKQVDGIFKD